MRPLTAETVEAMIIEAMCANDWATVENWRAVLDELDLRRTLPPIIAAALWYAERGLGVFPLQPGKKIPYPGTRGCKDASSDADVIRQWWKRWPNSNLAIATGHLVDVIDIDGPLGVKSWAGLENMPLSLGVVTTPRAGGNHLYVRATGQGNRAGIAPGVDYRGAGGYVVAPPSVSAEGVIYRWLRPLDLSRATGACAVCGERMIIADAGQTTHPCCEAVAA